MNITSAKYFKSSSEGTSGKNTSIQATIDGRKMSVPLSEKNRHYVEILKQVKEGTLTIKEAE